MRVDYIIKQAQLISGIGVFEDNASDETAIDRSLAIFHGTLNDINSDPKITLWQETWDYQKDREGESISIPPKPKPHGFINLPQLEEEAPPPLSDEAGNRKFPGFATPFPVSMRYLVPSDCRRVISAFSGNAELRKTAFSELVKSRLAQGRLNIFAVNDRKIELAFPCRLLIVYAKQFKDFTLEDECDLPLESIAYVVNLLAFNLALAYDRDSVDRCKMLAEKSYNALAGTLAVNAGNMYQSVYAAMNRFSGRGGSWL